VNLTQDRPTLEGVHLALLRPGQFTSRMGYLGPWDVTCEYETQK
jgi:hypothetical protein